jgi:hypothetical protein
MHVSSVRSEIFVAQGVSPGLSEQKKFNSSVGAIYYPTIR